MAENTAEAGNLEAEGGETLAAVLEKKNEQIPHTITGDEKLEHSRVRYAIRIDGDTFGKKVDEVIADLRRQVAIPGFRKGKAPVNLVRNQYGRSAREEAVRKMVPRLAELAAEEKKVENLAQPFFEGWNTEDNGDVTVKIILEVRPEINVTDETLKDINIEATVNPVTDERVEQELQRLRESSATFRAVENATYEEGDALHFTIEVMDTDGNRIPEYCAKDHYSSNVKQELPPAVLSAIIGHKAGDTVEVNNVDLPQPQGDPLKINVVITLNEIKKRDMPALDDEFAKDVSEQFETIDDLRNQIRQDLEAAEENRQRSEKLQEVYKILRNRLDFDIPGTLVQRLANQSIERTEQQLNQYGISLKNMTSDYIDQYLHKTQNESRLEAKNMLIAEQVGRFLSIEATEEMVDAEIRRIAELQGRKPLAIRAALEAQKRLGALKAELRMRAINDRLISLANVKIVEKKAEQPAESPGE